MNKTTIMALAAAILLSFGLPAVAEPTGRFAVVSDIHFDPFDPPDITRRLADAEPADWAAILDTIKTQAVSGYGSDTNHALFRSALAAVAEVAADADFVIVPGDFLAHGFQKKAAAALGVSSGSDAVADLAEKTTNYVAGALRAALPDKPLILALGNDDAACGDYELTPGGPFLAATAETIRDMLGPEALDPDFDTTYSDGGYYAVGHPTLPGTTVLVVNDVLWSERYRDACSDRGDDAGARMLDWLEQHLERAQAADERIWLVRHIPAGIDAYSTLHSKGGTCASQVVPYLRQPYANWFAALMRKYAWIVQVSLAGHIHHDTYRLWTGADGAALGVDKVVPAISPVFGQNPGFQVFDYDTGSGTLADFETWYLTNLAAASLETPGDWKREYVFTEAYWQPDYSVGSVAAVWRSLVEGDAMRETFARLYPVGHGEISPDDLPAYVCAIGHIDRPGFTACHCAR